MAAVTSALVARAQTLECSTLSTASSSPSPDIASPANGKVLCMEHAAMDADISASEAHSPSNNHQNHENGLTNGYSAEKPKSSKSSHRDKERDHKSRSKDHKSSRDKDKDRHHSSSSKDKSSSHKSSSRDKDKDRHRDKDKHKSSSSSSRDKDKGKDREHRSSKNHKSKDRSKDKERSKEHREKDKDRHRHSSSSKDKHRDKDRHREKDKERKDRKSDTQSNEESPEKTVDIKQEPKSQQQNGNNYYHDEEIKVEVKMQDDLDEKYNNSQASSCDYNLSQFKDESKFEEEQAAEEESEEEIPLAKRLSKRRYSDSDDEKPVIEIKKAKKSKKRSYSDDDFSDVKPVKKQKKKALKPTTIVNDQPASPTKRRKKKAEEEQEVWKWWEEEKRDDGTKWRYLEHKGPVFAPDYEGIPKNVKFYYDGKEMSLSEETEEVAGFYARMLDHDYTTKEVFNNNFFKDWRKVMTDEERKKITDLNKCNFKKMHAYFMDVAEKNRNRTKEEKLALKEKNEEVLKEYGFCTIDGHKEKIGNFRIEPPGLFRGRGEHPKMGMLKKRVMPEDVLINCSKDSAIPKPPPGRKWKEVRHDPGVTWLASWTENVQNQVKYVMLNPSSKLKGEKDWQKYETARRLHKCIDKIRKEYKDDWKSKEMRIRQRAVALYFIDKLALRAGNEKDEDQADTVGCCSLRVEHIKLHDQKDDKEYVVVFDFLGKDSIRYFNEVPVEKRVFKNLQLFMENKSPGDDLFDRLNTSVMNKHLSELMEGLTAKVFRTYNASFTLQQQLDELTNAGDSVSEKILSYNRANRAVAILCNHQRAVPKGHSKSMEKLKERIDAKRVQVKDTERAVKDAARDAKHGSVKEKQIHDQKKKQLGKMREQLVKLEIQETDRDENKAIALGTSKLNYLDPRISVAWCKKYDVPIEKIYNKTQRDKFRWAIDMAGPDFVF